MRGPEERAISARAFDLALTIESGQFFRYRTHGQGYRLVVRDRVIEVRQEGDRLFYRGADEAFLRRILALDVDTTPVRRRLLHHAWLRPAIEATRGLRILRQDLWECLLGFACATISNLPRIRKNVEDLARLYGRPIVDGVHALPRPGEIRDDGRLVEARLGFRAPRILALQSRVDEAWLQRLATLPEDDQRRWLVSLPGIGEKVADCVLLFALGREAAFPVDVWIQRVVERRALRRKSTPARIRAWARRTFGRDAGYAQQALFVWGRRVGRDAL